MSQTIDQDKQVAVIQNSIEVFRSAPEILKANQDRTSKAVQIGNSILKAWADAWAVQDEDARMEALKTVDERSNNFLANCGAALKEEKEARAAITQLMDEFKKLFTEAEAGLDKSKAASVPARVQVNRDDYAKESFKIQERKRQEAEKKAAQAKERIEVKAKMEIALSAHFNNYLLQVKQRFNDGFNALELDGFADKGADIRAYQPDYKQEHFNSFVWGGYTSLPKEELAVIRNEVMEGKYELFRSTYIAEMTALKKDIVDKLPSKFAELQEQRRLEIERQDAERAAANAKNEEERKAAAERQRKAEEDAKRTADEKQRRESEEADRLAKEAEDAKLKAEQEAELKKQGEQTMVMFEQEAAVADVSTPEVRQGFDITVLHQAGYVQIFQLWFENEGKNLPLDKMGNTKLDQMKAWAEKHAHKTGTKIEGKFLKYEESFTAVNRKAK